jgi:hypothetical protein
MGKYRLLLLFIIGLNTLSSTQVKLKYEDYIYDRDVKSVLTYINGLYKPLPILRLQSNDVLHFQFDDINDSEDKEYRYKIIHCTKDWEKSPISEMDYLLGYNDEPLRSWEFSQGTFVQYTHFYIDFPNSNTQFKASGNYILLIYDRNSNEKPVITKRFMITEELVLPTVEFIRPISIAEARRNHQFSLQIALKKLNTFNPQRDIYVHAIQNGNWISALYNLKAESVLTDVIRFNSFGAINFFALNEFRNFDTRSLLSRGRHVNRINRETLPIEVELVKDKSLEAITYSLLFDFNGKYFINNLDFGAANRRPFSLTTENLYRLRDLNNIMERPFISTSREEYTINPKDFSADYVNVKFSLDLLPNMRDKYYVFGELTNWQISPENELIYNTETEKFEANLLLKQGYYDYMYAKVGSDGKVDLHTLQGTWQETENDYTFLTYLREYGARLDRLIGVRVLSSRY